MKILSASLIFEESDKISERKIYITQFRVI